MCSGQRRVQKTERDLKAEQRAFAERDAGEEAAGGAEAEAEEAASPPTRRPDRVALRPERIAPRLPRRIASGILRSVSSAK